MLNTEQILLQKYGDRYVPLEEIAPVYYGVSHKQTIRKMAAANGFDGLVPFKARKSENAPWLVDLVNLASVLDRRAIEARK